MKASAINPQFDSRRTAGSLSRTQRSALVAARDAEDNRVDRGFQNIGEGDVQVTSATLRALVERGLGTPIGVSPIAFAINALGIEVAEQIKPYVALAPKPPHVATVLFEDITRNAHAGGWLQLVHNDFSGCEQPNTLAVHLTDPGDEPFDIGDGGEPLPARPASIGAVVVLSIEQARVLRDSLNQADLGD